jgi:hypothetical protein
MAAALFVPWNYEPYRCVIQPVEQRQHYTARIAEHRINTQLNKRIDYYLGACFERRLTARIHRRARLGTHFFTFP